MKNCIYKLFLWFRDRFSFLFQVVLRLDIGEKKKEKPDNESERTDSEGGCK